MSYQTKLVMCNMLRLMNLKDEQALTKAMNNETEATSKITDLARDYRDAKKNINAEYEYDDVEREQKIEEIEDQYKLDLAELNEWQTEIDNEKVEKQTVIAKREDMINMYEEEMPEEIKKDHTYGYN